MKSPFFNFFLPLLILLTILLFFWGENEPQAEKTEKEIALELLEDITLNEPRRIDVLYNNQYVDKKSRIRYNTLIFKTDEEFEAKSPKNPDKSDNVLSLLKEELPEYNFGTPLDKKANYSHLLIGNAEWTIVSLHTDRGFFSKWVKKVDVHQLLNEDI